MTFGAQDWSVTNLSSLLRVALGLFIVAVGVIVFMIMCALLLPWRSLRIRACNVFGHIVGRAVLWVAGAKVAPGLRAQIDPTFPAIYVSNHTSPTDIFLGIWLDGRVGTSPLFLVIGLLLGLAAAVGTVVAQVRRFL